MKLFYLFFTVIVLQRLAELMIAKRNEKWMKQQGAIEFGKDHYGIMVSMHLLFFVSFMFEVLIFRNTLSPLWIWLLPVFLITQFGRMWALTSLGKYWNTKIIVLPNANVVRKGPYRFIKHPNYAIVTLELLVIPLLFQAYITAAVFTVLNIAMLSIRIPAEEHALKTLTKYEGTFKKCNRFVPKM